MPRPILATAAALLLLSHSCSYASASFVGPYELRSKGSQTSSPETSGPEPSAQTLSNEEEDPASQIFLVETEHYTLLYPKIFDALLPLADVIQRIEQAFARVQALLGKFEQHVEMFVPSVITIEGTPSGLVILGVTYVENGQIKVAVILSAADVSVFAHELLHARLRDLGIRPPRWIEEGMAHYVENEDGFNPELFQILEEQGALSLKDAKAASDEVSSKEMVLRATGWAVVYYLLNVKGMSLLEVAEAADFPETDVAVAAVTAACEAQASTSK